MTAPAFIVANPTAGAGRARALWSEVTDRLRAIGIPYEYELTQGPMTAASFTRQALRAGAEIVVVVGGDGTLNEALNGFFLGERPIRPDASLLMVPAGASCDVARGLGVPGGAAAVGLLREGRLLDVDVGRAIFTREGRRTIRYFLNSADVGIGARIARRAARFKAAGGRAAFLLSTAAVLFDPQPWSGRLRLNGAQPEGLQAITAVVALGPFTGGGMEIAPGARWDDGLFEVIVIDDMPPGELLANLPSIYAGTHLSHPGVHHWQANEVAIDTLEEADIQLDGEVVGAGSVEFSILPAALRVYAPKP